MTTLVITPESKFQEVASLIVEGQPLPVNFGEITLAEKWNTEKRVRWLLNLATFSRVKPAALLLIMKEVLGWLPGQSCPDLDLPDTWEEVAQVSRGRVMSTDEVEAVCKATANATADSLYECMLSAEELGAKPFTEVDICDVVRKHIPVEVVAAGLTKVLL